MAEKYQLLDTMSLWFDLHRLCRQSSHNYIGLKASIQWPAILSHPHRFVSGS